MPADTAWPPASILAADVVTADGGLVRTDREHGCLLTGLPAAAIDAVCATAMPRPGSPIASLEVRHLGGALTRRPPADGALPSLPGNFAVYAVGMAPTPGLVPRVAGALDLLLDTLGPWDADCRYPNFAKRRAGASEFYPAGTAKSLRRIKAAYDPDELITSNHPIKPQPNRHTPSP